MRGGYRPCRLCRRGRCGIRPPHSLPAMHSSLHLLVTRDSGPFFPEVRARCPICLHISPVCVDYFACSPKTGVVCSACEVIMFVDWEPRHEYVPTSVESGDKVTVYSRFGRNSGGESYDTPAPRRGCCPRRHRRRRGGGGSPGGGSFRTRSSSHRFISPVWGVSGEVVPTRRHGADHHPPPTPPFGDEGKWRWAEVAIRRVRLLHLPSGEDVVVPQTCALTYDYLDSFQLSDKGMEFTLDDGSRQSIAFPSSPKFV